MKLIFCCEFYAPSVGGVQKVIQEVAEQMVLRGHEVIVATSSHPARTFNELNGVRIAGFNVSGNAVRGLMGDVEAYRRFLVETPHDALLIKAAQQWTFDAAWPVLDRIRSRKVFIPCGFSSLYEEAYQDYFTRLPAVLAQFDRLIFYSSSYRDIDFARRHGLSRLSVLPNGASEREFAVRPPSIRAELGIAEKDLLLLTVGSFTGLKGHLEALRAYERMDLKGRRSVLLLSGNMTAEHRRQFDETLRGVTGFRVQGSLRHLVKVALHSAGFRVGAALPPGQSFLRTLLDTFPGLLPLARLHPRLAASIPFILDLAVTCRRVNALPGKRVLVLEQTRADVVRSFFSANLFLFASNVEYSPLVLFEAAAAGLPFLTVPVGNSAEIAEWTGGGTVCPAPKDREGYTRAEPAVLARAAEELLLNPARLATLAETGRQRWQEQFTWARIADLYEDVLLDRNSGTAISS